MGHEKINQDFTSMGKKKRKSTKKRRPRPKQDIAPADESSEAVYFVSYDITYEPLPRDKKIPSEVVDQLEELHALIYNNPQEAIARLEPLKTKYPRVPILYNYLGATYSMVGDSEKVRAIARENYERNPDYLFAKINYAELCLRDGKYAEIPRIFDRKYDLTMLYPRRRTFHISEVVGFMSVVGLYYAEIGEKEIAQRYYAILRELEPHDRMTLRLGRRLRFYTLKRRLKDQRE